MADLSPETADKLEEACADGRLAPVVQEMLADAWDEGHAVSCVYYPDCSSNEHHPNPYREEDS